MALAWNPAFQLESTFHATSTPLVGLGAAAAIVEGALSPKAASAATVSAPAIEVFRMEFLLWDLHR